jgi:hypothetical protein
MSHPNHVVVEADGHVLDADYGVFIPQSLEYVKAHPALVDDAYAPKFAASLPLLEAVYADGWTETATKAAFDYTRDFEAEAHRWKWAPMLMVLWMATAIFDAGLCWPKFADGLPSFPRRRSLPT